MTVVIHTKDDHHRVEDATEVDYIMCGDFIYLRVKHARGEVNVPTERLTSVKVYQDTE